MTNKIKEKIKRELTSNQTQPHKVSQMYKFQNLKGIYPNLFLYTSVIT